jgi:hypothetical protein
MPAAAVLLLLQGLAEFVRCWLRAFDGDAAAPHGGRCSDGRRGDVQ